MSGVNDQITNTQRNNYYQYLTYLYNETMSVIY